MKIFGVTVVRNEADIVALAINYHLALGCTRVLVTDDGSTDGTSDIVGEIAAKSGRVEWRRHIGEFHQAQLLTELGREAFRQGADWIVPFDADEFWYAPVRTFAEVLRTTAAGALRAPVLNYVQDRDQLTADPTAVLRMTRRPPVSIGPADQGRALVEQRRIGYVEAMYPPKWITRAAGNIEILRGNHGVAHLNGRARTTIELVCLHAPARSRDALARKAEQSQRLQAARCRECEGWHTHRVRQLVGENLLDREWAANSYRDNALDVYGTARPLTVDTTLSDAVAPLLSEPRPSVAPAQDVYRLRTEWQRDVAQDYLTNVDDDVVTRTAWAAGLDAQLATAHQQLRDYAAVLAERAEWAQSLDEQLLVARQQVADLERQLAERTQWACGLDNELNTARGVMAKFEALITDRTQWAESLDGELHTARAAIAELELQLTDRTRWAQTLEGELRGARTAIIELESRVTDRTQWAQSLDNELETAREVIANLQALVSERTAWAQAADKEADRAREAFQRVRAELDQRNPRIPV
jgi:hypothetical protein